MIPKFVPPFFCTIPPHDDDDDDDGDDDDDDDGDGDDDDDGDGDGFQLLSWLTNASTTNVKERRGAWTTALN